MLSSLLSTLHLLALAIGLPGIFLRGRALRRLGADPLAVSSVLAADSVWGAAAILWLLTGLLRAFAGFEKGTAFYLHSPFFHLKMSLFLLVLGLELWPMITFLRWRARRRRNEALDLSRAATLARVNDIEVVITVATPFVASAMARGLFQLG
jgi:putative membrane protein